MMIALTAALAIVVQDHAPLRAAPRSSARQLTELVQGDVLEVRGERGDYLKVYEYHRERGGYIRRQLAAPIGVGEADAPALLVVLRFLREIPGSESLGISYGAAYLKAAAPRDLTAEPFDAIARMAERLAEAASGNAAHPGDVAAHVEVVEQFGIHMRSLERNGRMQVCYDGELFRRVLALDTATPEQRAHAALGLTRPDCIDPDMGPVPRAALDSYRSELLDRIEERGLTAITRSRLHARRASVYASVAYEQARRREAPASAAQRALNELLSVHVDELGDDRRAEYADAALRVGAIRWARSVPVMQSGPWSLSAAPGDPGQTCIVLAEASRQRPTPLVRRCTYGIAWLASAQTIPDAHALVLAVQPLESWLELWVFRERPAGWVIDVLSPGYDEPEEGYVEFAGFARRTGRLLIVREVKEHGRFHRRFEELRIADLVHVREASAPELLPDFGRYQDLRWRSDTLALR
jgi:hypothetical protein